MIPYSTQKITFKDKRAVWRTLSSKYLTQGPSVLAFEEAIGGRVGANHAVATSSATAALHLACLALGIGPGDLVWTVAISFVASANCARYVGADVDFVDIDKDTWNLSVAALKTKLDVAKQCSRLPKAIVVVHFAGEPAEMELIYATCQSFGVEIIEDASHALGSQYQGEPIGSCRYSAVTVFSFHAVKNITTGEGGMLVTNRKELADRARSLRSHGIIREPELLINDGMKLEPHYYEQQELGFNYRLTDIQASLGVSQLTSLKRFNKTRLDIWNIYAREFEKYPQIKMQAKDERSLSATHLAVIRVPSNLRTRIVETLRVQGYATNLHYFPIPLQPYYSSSISASFPEAEQFAREAITLPCHPKLGHSQARKIAEWVVASLD